ncbi:MAG: response regulator [Pseudomonadales bacterium]|nr:response regulator [Pseudomonadales bacterium]
MFVVDKKQTILIVDDIPSNLESLKAVLKPTYRVITASNGNAALDIAFKEDKPDMILLDIIMPAMDGYEVFQQLKANPATAPIPIILISAKDSQIDEAQGFELGAVDFITKPINPRRVLARVAAQMALYNQSRELELMVKTRTAELEQTQLAVISLLGRASEFKDNETGSHVTRMSHYARLLAEAIAGESNCWTQNIFHAAPMHDVGKIGVPDAILLKAGPLNPQEWAIMKKHPSFGAAIIGDHETPLLKLSKEIALTHHEKWDGSGYPQGLKGEAIPISGRIVAIADVFDALTTERPYKNAWSVEKSVTYLEEQSGSHFDAELVTLFIENMPDILEIKSCFQENNLSTLAIS